MTGKKNNNTRQNAISAKGIMRKYKISYQTINHYTNLGLLSVINKNANVRYYRKECVDKRLKKIRKLAEEGYTLHLIRKKLIGI